MLDSSIFKNPVDLSWFGSDYFTDNPYYNFILNDDVWLDNILLIKKGNSLNQIIVNKLMKFGIKKIQIDINTKPPVKSSYQELDNRNSIAAQSVLIVQKTYKEISVIAKALLESGFKNENVFAATNPQSTEKYLANKQLLYIFMDYEFFDEKIKNTIKDNCNERIINVFLSNSPANTVISAEEFQENINIKIMLKVINSIYIRALINQCPTHDYSQLIEKAKKLSPKGVLDF